MKRINLRFVNTFRPGEKRGGGGKKLCFFSVATALAGTAVTDFISFSSPAPCTSFALKSGGRGGAAGRRFKNRGDA